MRTYTNAKFIVSAASQSQFLSPEKPMIAVCGKSNVGKSTFINALAGQKKLAKVSSRPGRTRLINYFDFGTFILADLPGYGYAEVSKEEKARWAKTLDAFFSEKEKLSFVFALCDCRHNPTENDLIMLNFLYAKIIPFGVVATKADKLSRAQLTKNVASIASAYGCGVGDITAISSSTGYGFDKINSIIDSVISRAEDKNSSGEDG